MLRPWTAIALALPLLLGCSKKDGTEPAASAETSTAASSKAGASTPETGPADAAAAEPSARFTGEGFSLPIPNGFTAVESQVRGNLSKEMGQSVDAVLVKDRREGGFLPSIVLTRIAASDVAPADVKTCQEAATTMSQLVGAEIKAPAKMVSYSFGKTCQFEMGDKEQHAIQTIVYLDKSFWTLTCNVSPSAIESGRAECEMVLAGFGR